MSDGQKKSPTARKRQSQSARPQKTALPAAFEFEDHEAPGRLSKDVDRAKRVLDSIPDLTDAQLAELQRRVDQGYYGADEIVDDLAQKVAEVLFGRRT